MTPPTPYAAQQTITTYLREGRVGLPWLVLGLVTGFVILYMLTMIWRMLAMIVIPDGNSLGVLQALQTGSTPVAMFFILGSFALWFPALALAHRLAHDRAVAPLFGAAPVRQFFRVFNALLALHIVLLVIALGVNLAVHSVRLTAARFAHA